MGEGRGEQRGLVSGPLSTSTITKVTGQEMGKEERRREAKTLCTEGTYLSSERGEMRDVLSGSKAHTAVRKEGNIGLRASVLFLRW